jgi:hypothetical protein
MEGRAGGGRMSRRVKRRDGKGALELIEEAVHLLRLAPAGVLATYYVGALPFVLGLLYFWADMSRGAFAWRHCAQASLGVAILYIWMKCWQAVFARQLYARLTGETADRWNAARVGRLLTTQALIQPTSFFTLPVAALIALPFGWTYAFYHNLSLYGDSDPGPAARQAGRQASLWSGQNHVLMLVLWLFGFYVFANLLVAVAMVPSLLKMLFGVESAASMNPWALANTTVFAAVCCLAYLFLNPLIKAAYVLRCFYGESIHSGADLKAELKSLLPVVALVLLLFALPVAKAAEPATENRELPAQLDRSINEVINQPEFTWRWPREKEPVSEEQKGPIARFLDSIIYTFRGWLHSLRRLLSKIMRWIDEWMREHWKTEPKMDRSHGDWLRTLHTMLFVVLAAVVATLAIMIWRVWKQRRHRRVDAVAEPILPAVDLTDENVLADQLPADSWLAKARELMAAGDLRLALRALYLASLAHLGQRELIVIAKFKSNHDYARELRRRAQTREALLVAFGENVSAFERAWYGLHEVTPDNLEHFNANVDRIREGA